MAVKYIVALDVAEDNPALIGPFPTERAAQKKAEIISADWGNGFQVLPMYESYGEFIRYSTEGEHA